RIGSASGVLVGSRTNCALQIWFRALSSVPGTEPAHIPPVVCCGSAPIVVPRPPRPKPQQSVTPIEARVEAIATSIREAEGGLTAGTLIGLLGPTSHTMAILVLSVLNMIPGPPGYGGTVAIAMMGVTLAMLLGWPLRLDGRIGQR